MRATWTKGLLAVGCAAFAAAVVFEHPAKSAEQPKPLVKPDVPEGYVLVDPDSLRRLVHDEVARQLQDFFSQVRRGQQQQAAAGRLQSMLSIAATLRSQIALYRLQHHDNYPTLEQIGDGFRFLMIRTDADGNPSEGPNAIGPYMQQPAVNPLTGKSKVTAPGKATADAGWSYDPQSGRVKPVLPRQFESQLKGHVGEREPGSGRTSRPTS